MLNPPFCGVTSCRDVTTLLRERISWDRERLNPQLFVPGYLLALWPLTLVSVVQKNMIHGSTKIHLKRNIYPHIKKIIKNPWISSRLSLLLQFTNLKGFFGENFPPWLLYPFHFGSFTCRSWSITSSPSLSGGSNEGIGTGSSLGIFSRGALPGPSFPFVGGVGNVRVFDTWFVRFEQTCFKLKDILTPTNPLNSWWTSHVKSNRYTVYVGMFRLPREKNKQTWNVELWMVLTWLGW